MQARSRKQNRMQRNLTVFEFITLFVILPAAVSLTDMPFYVVFMPMFAAFAYAVWWLFYVQKMHWEDFWRSHPPAIEKKQLRFILQRFLVCSFLLLGLLLLLYPGNFLNFPRQYPLFFLFFIVLYPVLSVLPQELLYRTFFFKRYRLIFRQPVSMIMASTLSFGFLHIIFHNYLAILLTLVGGYFFSRTYNVTRSLYLVCFEHSLYGLLVFTLGFGGFFIRGLKEAGLVL
jgi:membrane protease YdiL (CAAX protease family)